MWSWNDDPSTEADVVEEEVEGEENSSNIVFSGS
jgi:hypothetical protein